MRRAKRRTFSGVVCEQIVFSIPDRTRRLDKAEPRPRFKTEEEREAHKLAISRRRHNESFNENFSPTSLYSTLTLDNEHEVHTFDDADHVAINYVRRLKYSYPDAVIFWYKGRGKSTHRIHFHFVSEGVPEEVIKEKWGLGDVIRIEHLREHNYYGGKDYGQDYTGLANYLFDHWTPEQGGKRWKQTKNARKPEREEPTEVKREYTLKKPPKAPEGYILVEATANSWGYLYFKYIVEPPKKKAVKKGSPPTDPAVGLL